MNSHNMPAFPCTAQGNRDIPPDQDYIQQSRFTASFPGMTLRDYFAGQALASGVLPYRAYSLADDMLALRVQTKPPQ